MLALISAITHYTQRTDMDMHMDMDELTVEAVLPNLKWMIGHATTVAARGQQTCTCSIAPPEHGPKRGDRTIAGCLRFGLLIGEFRDIASVRWLSLVTFYTQ